MRDQSRFTTADAALERTPLTTPAMATRNPVRTQETTHSTHPSPGRREPKRARARWASHSLAGYEDAEAGAHAPRRSAATSSAAATGALPPFAAIGPQRDSRQVGLWGKARRRGRFRGSGRRRPSEGKGGEAREQGALRSRTGSGRNQQEPELFLALREWRRGERRDRERLEQVGGKRSLRLPLLARLLALADFVGFLRGRRGERSRGPREA